MRIDILPKMEADFSANLVDSYGKKFTVVPGAFPYVRHLKLPNPTHFIAEKRTKKRIVCHFTAGVLKGDIATLTTNKVSTQFVLARDGTAYQLFDTNYCAYHLGPSNDGSYSNTQMSFESIAIEISNIGPLKLKDGVMYDIYGKPYCAEESTSYYDKVSFRGYDYYASFTSAQYKTLNNLLNDLCLKHSIPHTMISPGLRHAYGPKAAQGVGISTHVNWRKDKYDLAPNFDFSKLGL
jgi:N-acetyl-anhydromuramyl-L-alanine amidase AmpD